MICDGNVHCGPCNGQSPSAQFIKSLDTRAFVQQMAIHPKQAGSVAMVFNDVLLPDFLE
jgi:heterodisulfide reductase subunit C